MDKNRPPKLQGKEYYFDASSVRVNENSTVIVETEKGLQYGTVVRIIPQDEVNHKIEYKHLNLQ